VTLQSPAPVKATAAVYVAKTSSLRWFSRRIPLYGGRDPRRLLVVPASPAAGSVDVSPKDMFLESS
jgi:hypothetical protein